MTKHTIKNPNIDRTTPAAPEEEETRQPAHRGGQARELEDEVGGDREPMMVPPGTVVERELDPEALAVDRANARTSDRTDARDGVDASDEIARDPDAIGGKSPPR